MATPGGKKPNKQQINDAGNEVGLDLANAIGKAVSRALSSYDFSPLSKNIVKSIGKVDISAILKTDDAKIKQLAVNAKSTLENSIGSIKIGTEIDNDKLASVQKTLQQLSDLNIKASIASVDTSTIDKELAQIKPADIQAIVSSVDSSLIDSEVNKIKPIDLLAKINSVDSSLIDIETGNIKPIALQAIVGSVDTDAIAVELGKVNPLDLQAIVTTTDLSLIDKDASKIKPIDVLAKVASVDSTLVESEVSKLKPSELQAKIASVDVNLVDVEIGKINPIDLQAKVGSVDSSVIDTETSKIKSVDLLAKVSSVDSSLIATESNKLKPIDLQAAVTAVDSTLIDKETGNLKSINLSATVGSVDSSLVQAELSKLKPANLQATVTSVDTNLINTEIAKLNPVDIQASISSLDSSLVGKEVSVLKPFDILAKVASVDATLVDSEFSKLKPSELQAIVSSVDTSIVDSEIGKINPINLQASIGDVDISLIGKETSNLQSIDLLAKISTVDSSLIGTEASKLKPINLQAAIDSVDTGLVDTETSKLKIINLAAGIGSVDTSLIDATIGKLKSPELQAKITSVDTSLVDAEFGKLKIADLQALVTEVDTSLIGEEINKLNPVSLQALVTEIDTSALDKLPSAQINATVGEIQKPTRSVEELFGTPEITPKINFDADRFITLFDKSLRRLEVGISAIAAALKGGIGSDKFEPAIKHITTINRGIDTTGDGFNEVAQEVENLKRELRESSLVQQTMATNAKLYGQANTSLALTQAKLAIQSEEELKVAAQKLGIADSENLSKRKLVQLIADGTVKLQEQRNLVDNINSSYGDMEQAMKQVIADNKLKNIMVQTGLTGAYAETARLLELQKEQGVLGDQDYLNALKKLKVEQHIYEEKVKQRDITESLANWQLEMKEELEGYEKGWEKIKSKVKAIITDPKLAKTVFAAEGLKTAIESVKKFGEGFEKMKEQGLSAGQAATAQIKTISTMSVLGLSDTQGVMEQVIESYGNVNALSGDQVDSIGQMAHHMGITGQEAMKVNEALSQMGGETTDSAIEAMHFTENLAKASGVAPGKIMKDISKNSAAIALYSKDGAKGFGKAAVELHKMGVEIGTAAKMADGLLDFENSINKQMEASVLLGREINLDKAREMALAGDLEGATRETLANIGGAAEFTKMNVIQKKALAEAAGMTVEEMQKALDAEEEQQKYHGEEAGFWMNTIGYVSEYGTKLGGFLKEHGMLLLSGLNVLGQQETRQLLINGLQKGYNALKAIGNGVLLAGKAIFDSEARARVIQYAKDKAQWALEKAHIGWLKLNAFFGSGKAKEKLAAMAGGKITEKIGDKAAGMVGDKAADLAGKKAADLAGNKVADIAGNKAADLAGEKAADLAGDKAAGALADKATGVSKPGMTGGFAANMTNIAAGFQAMGAPGVGKGVFNTMLAGPALLVALPAIPFILFMGRVALVQLLPNFTQLASGLTAMSGTATGSLALMLFSVAAIPSLLSIPFLLFMGLTPLTQLAVNFTQLATGLTAMAATFAGSLALGVFGVAAIPSLLAIPFLTFMGLVPLAQLAVNFSSLAMGLTAMAGTFAGSAALAAFGLAATIAIPSLIFLGGISLLGAPAAAGLTALGAGLAAFGNPATALFVLIGIGLIAALGVAMIPFAAALAIATPAIEAFGNVIIGVFQQLPPIIAAISAGFVTIFSALADNWQILIPVGIGLSAVAIGLGALGAASLLAFPGLVLASVGLGLMQLPLLAISAVAQSGAITQFAESLMSLGAAGPGLLIASAGLIALGAAGLLAFPGLTLAGAGLLAMVPGLFLVNQVAQADTLTALAQTLTALSAASTGLASVSASLFGIAGGLGAIALAGLAAMPVIGALVGLAAVAPALASIGSLVGGGGGEVTQTTQTNVAQPQAKDEKMDILIAEIRSLKEVVAKGGVINMDGRKVGDVLRMAMNTSGVR